MKRMSWNIFCTLRIHVYMKRHDFHRIPYLILIYVGEDMGHDIPCHRTHGVHQPVFSFRRPFFFSFPLDGWLSVIWSPFCWQAEIMKRIVCRMAPLPPSPPPRQWWHGYTCDLVVAYIRIHMLLMPGINNVLLTWHNEWQRQKDTSPENPVEVECTGTPTTNIEVKSAKFVVCVFLLA